MLCYTYRITIIEKPNIGKCRNVNKNRDSGRVEMEDRHLPLVLEQLQIHRSIIHSFNRRSRAAAIIRTLTLVGLEEQLRSGVRGAGVHSID